MFRVDFLETIDSAVIVSSTVYYRDKTIREVTKELKKLRLKNNISRINVYKNTDNNYILKRVLVVFDGRVI